MEIMEKEIKIRNFPNLRTVYISYDIDDDTVAQFKKDLDRLIKTDEDVYNDNIKNLKEIDDSLVTAYKKNVKYPPIILDITSPGGSIYHGLAIYDIIRTYNEEGIHKIIAKVSGMCASMASQIILACDERIGTKNSSYLVHSLSSYSTGKLEDIRDNLEECDRLNNICRKIYSERSNISLEKLDEMDKLKKDWWISADEALEYGLITKII